MASQCSGGSLWRNGTKYDQIAADVAVLTIFEAPTTTKGGASSPIKMLSLNSVQKCVTECEQCKQIQTR